MIPQAAVSPRQTFEDNIRPAQLLLQVYHLLNSNDNLQTEGDMLEALRNVVHAARDEDLILIYNEVFLGLIRERAQLPLSTLKKATLCHLLRQAVVASCTALETYLPALLHENLPILIRTRGRDFIPRNDNTVRDYFADLTFSLDETLRLLGDENAAEYISRKVLSMASFKYLSTRKGVHVVGALLGLEGPWNDIAAHLNHDKRALMENLDDAVHRRNDIVHRADRPQTEPGGEVQEITYAWTQQAVDTIRHICLALDELVAARVRQIAQLAAD